ncbi:hypothetical protein [Luteitalea sp.]|uniref:hypothetical protein n=1 Tax=Luteitalea sp. TaxID=2004800 RepID=UPI0025C06ADD|nr:hypothetical protein [Luteitalea sp.]
MAHRLSFVLVAAMLCVTAVTVWAQTRPDPGTVPGVPQVLSGDNVGVRVLGPPDTHGRVPADMVVKLNGQWVEVTSPATMKLLGK